MAGEIRIKKKQPRGDDGHKVVSVRMKDETLERLDACGARVLRTDVCGSIVVSVKDGAYTVSPEKG